MGAECDQEYLRSSASAIFDEWYHIVEECEGQEKVLVDSFTTG